MVFGEILAQQFELGGEGRRAVVSDLAGEISEINAANHQLDGGRNAGLIEFSVAGDVAVTRIGCAGGVHAAVSPVSVHVAVINVSGPGAFVIGRMFVGTNVAGIGNGHMAEE